MFLILIFSLEQKWSFQCFADCLICNEGVKSIEHFLLSCKWASAVWFGSDLNYKVNVQQITTFDAWLGDMVQCLTSDKVCRAKVLSYISFTCWLIWKARCAAMYDRQGIDALRVIRSVSFLEEEWSSSCIKDQGARSEG